MSISINAYENYNANYELSATQNSEKTDGVKTQVVELKTSTPGETRTEEIKTGFKDVKDYSNYLLSKYSFMNTTKSMQGIPTTVNVSSSFLKKCMDDPEKAAFLEENLAAIPDCVKSAQSGCLGTITNLSYSISANGEISCVMSGTNDPDGKIAKENAKRKAEEQKEEQEKTAERLQEKAKESRERLEKLLYPEDDEFSLTLQGDSTEELTSQLIQLMNIPASIANGEIPSVDVRV